MVSQTQDYNTLINWWAGVCAPTNVKLYIGEAAYKAASGSEAAWKGQNGINELSNQVSMCRQSQYIGGYSMFEYSSFMGNSDLYNLIKQLQSTPVAAPTLGEINQPNPQPEVTQAPEDKPSEPTQNPVVSEPTNAPLLLIRRAHPRIPETLQSSPIWVNMAGQCRILKTL